MGGKVERVTPRVTLAEAFAEAAAFEAEAGAGRIDTTTDTRATSGEEAKAARASYRAASEIVR